MTSEGNFHLIAARRSWRFRHAFRCVLAWLLVSLLIPATAATGASGNEPRNASPTYDLVVLGKIDACWVCQFGPSPQITYRRVLAGSAPGGKAAGRLLVAVVAEKLLPEGGVPMYRSRQEEICILKRVVAPGRQSPAFYRVIDVMDATVENLARFSRQ